MTEESKIISKDFEFGSISGCVGQKINAFKKPGINEDGVMVIYSKSFILSLVIDAHFSRDITEIMLDQFERKTRTELGDSGLPDDQDFLKWCLNYSEEVITSLTETRTKGEASFIIFAVDLDIKQLHYFSVGDVMLFVDNPKRYWETSFQLGQRQYFEYINATGISGHHSGSIDVNSDMRIICTTDGLIDKPSISMEDVKIIFSQLDNSASKKAGDLAKYALENDEEDDNIAIVLIDKLVFTA